MGGRDGAGGTLRTQSSAGTTLASEPRSPCSAVQRRRVRARHPAAAVRASSVNTVASRAGAGHREHGAHGAGQAACSTVDGRRSHLLRQVKVNRGSRRQPWVPHRAGTAPALPPRGSVPPPAAGARRVRLADVLLRLRQGGTAGRHDRQRVVLGIESSAGRVRSHGKGVVQSQAASSVPVPLFASVTASDVQLLPRAGTGRGPVNGAPSDGAALPLALPLGGLCWSVFRGGKIRYTLFAKRQCLFLHLSKVAREYVPYSRTP